MEGQGDGRIREMWVGASGRAHRSHTFVQSISDLRPAGHPSGLVSQLHNEDALCRGICLDRGRDLTVSPERFVETTLFFGVGRFPAGKCAGQCTVQTEWGSRRTWSVLLSRWKVLKGRNNIRQEAPVGMVITYRRPWVNIKK